MHEGLAVSLYAPSVYFNKAIIVSALRGKRNIKDEKGVGVVSFDFDGQEKIHTVKNGIVVVEIQKPTYFTNNGETPISSIIHDVSKSLRGTEVCIKDIAVVLQDAIQKGIIDKLDVKRELDLFVEDLLLALPIRYRYVADSTQKDYKNAKVKVYGKRLDDNQPFWSELYLPVIRFMVAGVDLNWDAVKPEVYEVSVPGGVKSFVVRNVARNKHCIFAAGIGGEINQDVVTINLVEEFGNLERTLSLEEASTFVANSITRSTREILRLAPDHKIPVDITTLSLGDPSNN